jgi:imidazole glycerol phosphate synthase subunit HisF
MPTMKFTKEEETENEITFLDITISKEENNISFDIYRKPTTIDTIIPN